MDGLLEKERHSCDDDDYDDNDYKYNDVNDNGDDIMESSIDEEDTTFMLMMTKQ